MESVKQYRRTGHRDKKYGYSTKPRKRKAWNKGVTGSTAKKAENLSTSKSKLKNQEYPESDFQGFRIFDLSLLAEMITNSTCCKLCGSDVVFEEISTVGLGGEYALTCTGCQFVQSFSNCAKVGRRKLSYDLNQRAVLASRLVGNGRSQLSQFLGVMDLPPPVTPKTFENIQKLVLRAAMDEAQASMSKAIQKEIELNDELDCEGEDNEDNQPIKLKVKGDGTWQKRGFRSLNGAVSIIGCESEQVLDHEVLSSFCKACIKWQKEHGTSNNEAWNDWYSVHRSVCKRNYTGTAGGMESAGMIRIFKRSEEKYNVQYTQYIGDGDSKTFFNIVNAKPYGEKVAIQKLECIGHVGKRFGYHMRKLKADMKGKKLSDGKGLFGRGRLTDKEITSMQTYFTGAIRNNSSSLCQMIKAVWAIWYHKSSTDENPQHQFCPVGSTSWCKYQRAKALKSLQNFNHENTLPEAVADAIKPVFIKMTSISLLKRCLGGQTQNSNESFNNILWKICPKNIFVGFDTLKLGANIATVLFNDGMSGILRILRSLDSTPGLNSITAARRKDQVRIREAEAEKLEDVKKKRMIYRKLRIDLHDNFIHEEGEQYEAGAF